MAGSYPDGDHGVDDAELNAALRDKITLQFLKSVGVTPRFDLETGSLGALQDELCAALGLDDDAIAAANEAMEKAGLGPILVPPDRLKPLQ
jgi:hypothetical protein